MTHPTLQFNSSAKFARGFSPVETGSIAIRAVSTVSGTISGTQVVKDIVYNLAQTGSNTFVARVIEGNFPLETSFSSATPGVCSVDSSGNTTLVSDGLCVINIDTQFGRRQVSGQVTSQSGVVMSLGSVSTGSLLKYLLGQRDALLSHFSAGIIQRWAVNGDGSGGYNTGNLLTQTVSGWTPITTGLSQMNVNHPISYKHIMMAAHVAGVGPYNNYWTMLDGSPVYAWSPATQVKQGSSLFYPSTYGKVIGNSNDTVIIYTPSANYSPIRTLPASWRTYLPTTYSNYIDIPVWTRRHNTNVAGETAWIQSVSLSETSLQIPLDSQAATFCQPSSGTDRSGRLAWGGDSGSGVFLTVNGEAVLMGEISFSGGSMPILYPDNLIIINKAMQDLAQQAGDAAYASYEMQTIPLDNSMSGWSSITGYTNGFNRYP